MTDKNLLKSWFENGKKPTQEQFWAWMDSYFHKSELFQISNVEDLERILNEKAEQDALEALSLLLDEKVDKKEGYQLSEEDFTTFLKDKLEGLRDHSAEIENIEERIVGVLRAPNNLDDLDNVEEARENLGILSKSLDDLEAGVDNIPSTWAAKDLATYMGKSGYSIQWLNNEMKLALRDRNDFILSTADLSSLATGDLEVSVLNPESSNPILIFKQGGVEVARVPLGNMLNGFAVAARLNGYILQFVDSKNMTVYNVDLKPLFDDIGNFRDFGLGASMTNSNIPNSWDWNDIEINSFHRGTNHEIPGISGNLYGFSLVDNSKYGVSFGASSTADRYFLQGAILGVASHWREIWHTGNLRSNAENDARYLNSSKTRLDDVAINGRYIRNYSSSGFPNAVSSSQDNYINKATLQLISGNSSLNFIGDNTTNSRRAGLQSGHSLPGYANITGILELNPLGGDVKINGFEAFHSGNIRSNTQNDDRYALSSRVISAGAGLTGGGNFTANRTIGLTASNQNLITNSAQKNAANTFTAENTFNQPIVVPNGVATNEAVNLSQLNSKENTLQSGTLNEILAGTSTIQKKWSAKVIADGIDRMIERELDIQMGSFSLKQQVFAPSTGTPYVYASNQRYYKRGRLVTLFLDIDVSVIPNADSSIHVLLTGLPYSNAERVSDAVLNLSVKGEVGSNYMFETLYYQGEEGLALYRVVAEGKKHLTLDDMRNGRMILKGQFSYLTNQ